MRRCVLSALGLVIAVVMTTGFANANSLPLIQSPDQSGSFRSQYDTQYGYTITQVYDNFTLATSSQIDNVKWWGTYGAASPSPIDSFTINFYYGLQPSGADLLSSQTIASSSNSTSNEAPAFVDANNFQNYVYSTDISPVPLHAGTYWISIVANMYTNYSGADYAPLNSWSWSTGSGGDGTALQDDSSGYRAAVASDFAFVLSGSQPGPSFLVPEPGTVSLLGVGVAALSGVSVFRRRRNAIR